MVTITVIVAITVTATIIVAVVVLDPVGMWMPCRFMVVTAAEERGAGE